MTIAVERVQTEAKLRYALFPFDLGDITYLAEHLSLEELEREANEVREKEVTDPVFWRPYKDACELAIAEKQLD